jgi:CarS bacterial SH3 domain
MDGWTDEMIGAFVRLNFSKLVYHDIAGAPFRIGERVRVVLVCDETGNPRFLRRIGIVKFLEYSCGCGQTYPDDPMIGVDFGRKIYGKQVGDSGKKS